MAIVEHISLETSELPLSGLRCLPETQNPVGLIIALHGGSYTAGYWHAESLPESSLLRETSIISGDRLSGISAPRGT